MCLVRMTLCEMDTHFCQVHLNAMFSSSFPLFFSLSSLFVVKILIFEVHRRFIVSGECWNLNVFYFKIGGAR